MATTKTTTKKKTAAKKAATKKKPVAKKKPQAKKRVSRGTKKPKNTDVVVVSPVDPSSKLVVAAELSDDAIIEQELMGEVLPYFIYQFNQKGGTITGLTVKGVSEVVRRLNRDKKSGYNIRLNPEHCKIERDVEQDGQKGVAVTVYAENLLDGNSAWGTKFEPYKKTGRNGQYNNEFAVEKALSKAERNAKRKLIPETAATKMIQKMVEGGEQVKQLSQPPAQANVVTPLPPKPTSIEDLKNIVRNGVSNAKTVEQAMKFDEKTQESDKFDAEFKKEVRGLASKRVDELQK